MGQREARLSARSALLGGAALVYLALLATLPRDGFWITDGGNKFIQAQSIALSGFRTKAIAYPAAGLDPAFRFFPDGGGHFQRIGNAYFSVYPPYFPMIVAAAYRLLGGVALPLLSAIPMLLALALAWRIGGAVPTAALAFATPLLFYAMAFWEHALAVLLVVAAFAALERCPWLAGILLGAATLMREESYVLLAATAAALLAADRAFLRPLLLAAGAAPVILAMWWTNYRISGHILGLHGAVYGIAAGPLRNLFFFLVEFDDRKALAWMMAVPFVAALAAGAMREPPRWLVNAIALAACLPALVALHRFATVADPVFHTSVTQGLFPAVPLLTFVLIRWRMLVTNGATRLHALVVLIAIPVTCLLLNASYVGLIWGPRYFLALLPLAIPLAWLAAPDKRVFAAVAIVSLALQLWGIHLLRVKTGASHRLVAALQSLEEDVVVTDVFWLPEEAAAAFYEKKLLMVRNDAELRELRAVLGARPYAFVASRDYRALSNAALAPLVRGSTKRVRVASPRVPFLDVMILSIESRSHDRTR